MPDFSDSRKGRRPSSVDGSLTRLSTQRGRPTRENFKGHGRSKARDTEASTEFCWTPTAETGSSTPEAPRQTPPSNMNDEKGDGSCGQRPEHIKYYLVRRGFDPLKPLPRKVEWALHMEVARRQIIRVNPFLPPRLVCFEETVMPPSTTNDPFCMYFAETDSIHVPNEISHRGAFDVPMLEELGEMDRTIQRLLDRQERRSGTVVGHGQTG